MINANTTLDAVSTFITYTVTYAGNGNTGGSVPVDGSSPYTAGSTVSVLGNTGSLVNGSDTFGGWQINGAGTIYQQGGANPSFVINANTTLDKRYGIPQAQLQQPRQR